MKALRIRQQQTVTDPLQSERLLKALTIILEHQEDSNGSSMLCSSLNQPSTTRRHHRKSTFAKLATSYVISAANFAFSGVGQK